MAQSARYDARSDACDYSDARLITSLARFVAPPPAAGTAAGTAADTASRPPEVVVVGGADDGRVRSGVAYVDLHSEESVESLLREARVGGGVPLSVAALRSFNASEASLVQQLRTSTSVRTGLLNHLDLTVAREAEHDELAARILALWRATARRYLSVLDSLRDIY